MFVKTKYRLKVGMFYYSDPETHGLANTWTSSAHEALLFTFEQAVAALSVAVNSEHLKAMSLTLEPV